MHNGTVISDCCIVILHKGAITEVIIVYDLNAREFFHGDAKFSREFCMGMPNSVGNFEWGRQFPSSVGDIKNNEGVPNSLRDFDLVVPNSRGCWISYVTGKATRQNIGSVV